MENEAETQPEATELEQEQGPERINEEEDMRGYGPPDPDLPTDDE